MMCPMVGRFAREVAMFHSMAGRFAPGVFDALLD
jgi:hypothetical protein